MWVQQQDYEKLGEILAEKRGQVTQQELAKRLKKPQSFISSYENGQRRVDILEFLRIAAELKADPVKLFGEIVRGMSARTGQKK